ncbi:MAG: tail fiber domain-containing protein [Aquimonas sp.]|nr:tail fiber domain-containing protein [Aquimonas sp.]
MSPTRLAHVLTATLTFALLSPAALAASFVYEGRLDDAGQPANGRYDLKLSAYTHQILGAALAEPITFHGVEVVEGRFRLDLDLPLRNADEVWLEVAVREAGSAAFSGLPGRSQAKGGSIGTCWSTTGDAGSSALVNFLGTTDNVPLVIRTNNMASLRITPNVVSGTAISANVVAGSSANRPAAIGSSVRGATVGGGGAPVDSDPAVAGEGPNRVTDHYGTVGGGAGNRAGNDNPDAADAAFATVGGGAGNTASGRVSTVVGGRENLASAEASTVGGGLQNTASGVRSTVGGGASNTASGSTATVGGGALNCAGGAWSWAGGRRAKIRPGSASGEPGEGCTGVFAEGVNGHRGTFAWADSQDGNFISGGEDQFLVRAQGSVQFTHDNLVSNNAAAWFTIRAPEGRDPLRVSVGGTGVLTGFANGGLRIGNVTGLVPPTPGANGLLVMGGARRSDNQSTWDTTSDARVKHQVKDIEAATEALLALSPTRFRYRPEYLADNGGEDREHLGYIAQELLETLPNAVSVDPEADPKTAPLLRVNTSDIQVLTTAAARELAIQQQALEAELVDLRGENANLRARLERMEALLQRSQGGR